MLARRFALATDKDRRVRNGLEDGRIAEIDQHPNLKVVCEKRAEGLVESEICGVRFVRLVGRYGFSEE